jgi:hypothetical protein
MWNSEIKQKPKSDTASFFQSRGFLIGFGVASIVLSVIVLGACVYEGFFNGERMKMIELPGFHELKLETPGLYAGVYQHMGSGPLPIKELSQMDVRVMSKDTYEDVPVIMNSAGQTFDRLGMRGLPLFNFAVANAGAYTLSGVYTNGVNGPSVRVLLFSQAAGNIKQTLIVGVAFFLVFLTIGIVILTRLDHWAPKKK